MATPNLQALVEQIKADLLRRGSIPAVQTTNCHAFEITGRAAWQTRHLGAMLILKQPAQNGCQWDGHPKVSHDSINYPDGNVDCLVNAGPPSNENRPAWDWKPGTHSATDADAVAPWDLDASPDPPPVDPPLPPPPPPRPSLPDLSQLPSSWSPSGFPSRSLGYYTEAAAGLEQIYRIIFGRAADFGGAGNWMWHIIEGEQPPLWVANRFMESEEYQARVRLGP